MGKGKAQSLELREGTVAEGTALRRGYAAPHPAAAAPAAGKLTRSGERGRLSACQQPPPLLISRFTASGRLEGFGMEHGACGIKRKPAFPACKAVPWHAGKSSPAQMHSIYQAG